MAMRSKRETKREAKQPERRTVVPASAARERILRAVDELFYRDGVQAVGVDAVIEHAGVNKMSLYRNFGSKDQLITAFLEDRDRQYWELVGLGDAASRARSAPEALRPVRGPAGARDPQGLSRLSVRQPGGGIERSRTIRPARRHAQQAELRRRLASLAKAAEVNDPDALSEFSDPADGGRLCQQPDLRAELDRHTRSHARPRS